MSPCEVFSGLSNRVRIDILGLLRQGEKNVTEIAQGLNLGQTHVSHNLRKLTSAKLVRMRREGQFRYYSLNIDTQRLLELASVMYSDGEAGIFRQDVLPFSFVVTDAQGVYVMAGGDVVRRLRIAEQDLVGKSLFDIYHDDPNVCAHMRKALSGEELSWKTWAHGRALDVRTVLLRDPQGTVTGTISFIFDVTPRDLTAKIFVYLRPCPCESGDDSWRCCFEKEAASIWTEFCPCGSSKVIRDCCMREAG